MLCLADMPVVEQHAHVARPSGNEHLVSLRQDRIMPGVAGEPDGIRRHKCNTTRDRQSLQPLHKLCIGLVCLQGLQQFVFYRLLCWLLCGGEQQGACEIVLGAGWASQQPLTQTLPRHHCWFFPG